MNQPDSKQVRRSISRFRKLTLASVATIMVINIIMIYRVTAVLDEGAASRITNAGTMRLLSQRIRSNAFEIDTAVRNGQWGRLEQLHNDLLQSISTMSATHDALFADKPVALPNASTEELDQIAAIAAPYQRLRNAADELRMLTENTIRRAPYIDTQTRERISGAMEDIRDAQSELEPRTLRLVERFSARSRAEIDQSTSHARIGLLVLAATLGAMVLFIIEPTILIVRRQLHDLDRATRHARRADSVRWRLLTNMGHEFRTPMNAILGFTDLLNDQSLSPSEQQRLAASIQNSAANLASLIETMLDMSAIESGQLRITPSDARLRDILAPCIDRAHTEAHIKGLQLRVNLDDSCDKPIRTEPKRLAQIADKLLQNAVKFTPSGHISINAAIEQIDDQTDRIRIEISDSGIGIDPAQHQHIFDAFHQAQSNLTREFGGSGLGLSFARDLARAMNGDITVQSQPDHGATFTLTIDAPHTDPEQTRPETQPQPAPNTIESLAQARILIVDDAKDNRVLLQHYFKSSAAHTDFAYDGQQAIERILTAIDQNTPYHIVLMDMQMPVLDGYSATKKLREMGITTPIIALTAHALDGDREQCLAAGCDEYLTKPVVKATLLQTCQHMLGIQTQDPAKAA